MKFILVGALLLLVGLTRANPTDSIIKLKEVLVVANRIPALKSSATLGTSLVNDSVLQQAAGSDLTTVLSSLTGIQTRTYGQPGGQSSLSIWGASSQQALVLLDGHQVMNPISGTPDPGLVPLAELSGIEVARGAGSSLYGSSALGGVVNLLPFTARNQTPGTWFGDAVFGGGTSRSADASVRLGRRFDKWGSQAFWAGGAFDGPRTNDQEMNWGAGLGAGLYPNQNQKLDFDCDLANRSLGLPGPKPDPNAIPMFGDSLSTALRDSEQDRFVSLRANWTWQPLGSREQGSEGAREQVGEGLSIEFKPDWRLLQTRYWTLPYNATSPDSLKLDDYQSQGLGGSLIVHYDWARLQAVVGFDHTTDLAWVQSQTDTNWQGRSADNGVWAELNALIAGLAKVSASAREDLAPGFGHAFNPGLGIAVPLGQAFKFRAHWGTAFRAPTISDRYWPKSGVPDLKPEHGMTAQAGFDWQIPKLVVNATGFLRTTSNLISWQPDTGGLWRPANVDSSRHLGAELMLDVLPVSGLDVRAGATWLSATQVRKELVFSDWSTGETRSEFVRRQAAFLPMLNLNAQASYRFHSGTRVKLSGRFETERLNYYPNYDSVPKVRMDTKRLPALAVLDCEVGQRFLKHWEAVLTVDNVLNRSYSEQFGNSISDRDYPMPGRSVAIQLRYAIE
jgi:vitamin B12 transporter